MEYLWIASVTAMIAQTAFWTLLMYLSLFYACRKIKQPIFSRLTPWTLAVIIVCVIGTFLPQKFAIQLGSLATQSILYFYIWYQCILGIRQMETVYGNLNTHALLRAYWVELGMVAIALYLRAVPFSDAFTKAVSPMVILVQAWKAYLLYQAYRNYVIRREQLSMLSDEI